MVRSDLHIGMTRIKGNVSTQLGFWQDGDPTEPSIVSKQITVAYWERQCPLWFPSEEGVSVPKLAPVNQIDSLFGGWDIRYALPLSRNSSRKYLKT